MVRSRQRARERAQHDALPADLAAAALSLGHHLDHVMRHYAVGLTLAADRPPRLAELAEPIACLGVVLPRLGQRIGRSWVANRVAGGGRSSSVGGGV